MARFYMLTGKWAGNGLSNEFIKWFDPLVYAAVHYSLSWTRSATFDACPDAFDCKNVDLGEQEYNVRS